jgi:hypothetical protein
MKEMQEFDEAERFWLNGKDKMLMIPQDWKVAGDWIRAEKYDALLAYTKELAAARASEGGWIEVEQELPPIPEKLNLSAIVMGLYEFGSFDFMRYNKRTMNWRVLPSTRPAKNNVIMWHALPKLPSPPLSVETPKEGK